MDTVELGRTGLRVSVAALGCGGHSRLGQSMGLSEDHSVALVRQALEAGVNFIDTAECYGTEAIVGRALAESGVDRQAVVISTKMSTWGDRLDAASVGRALEGSLRRLRSDYVDVYHAHGVRPERYPFVRDVLVPELLKYKEQGKIRRLGITEYFIGDSAHEALRMALADEVWEVMMVGCNLLNFSARRTIFPLARQRGIGTMLMFAVRRALSRPEALVELVAGLAEAGVVDPAEIDPADPLGFLREHPEIGSIPEAAYRFARHHSGADLVQTGTSNPEHLRDNLAAIHAPPLPPDLLERIEGLFGGVDSVSGN